ncbi:MAG: hypothetical protein UU29_C0012G0026 [Candidatus Daviesbacteria bacterium GW2011_GWA2_40_9]|uniref:AI-2E family transporter n=1 Tax=Candidatus Daviesbacteria bacterium GW2011_GWA2_40_9 TaxID=1618424 RepID=A0A0G0U079_9BACT|nr:MAG: hypothetical protein UU26_C0016G0004 [Candidatus Daviesbacteria bacterium GW2011_GWC1_40_9]KKR82488.1 MAG: hypothetical protein UU29_C0012G0026 [Candidatus Daviesbacteria bacterium GW2011_GWA2_40_9]
MAGFLLLLWVLFLILDIILLIFLAFILMSALAPLVERLAKWKIPRPLAIALIFILVIGSFSSLIAVGLTPLLNQTSSLTQRLAEATSSLLQTNFIDQSIVRQEFSEFSRRIIDFILSFFGNLIAFATVVVLTFYLLLDREKIENLVASFFAGRQQQVGKLIGKLEEKLGAWLRGQLFLSVLVGVFYYVGLVLLGVEFALPLAILGALLEVVPVIGPIIAAIPAILIALTTSPFLAAIVAGLYFAIQQIESHVVVPQVMKRAVGLNPILVILAVTIGGRLLGIGGALLAVPIAVVIQVILSEVLKTDIASPI